MKRFTIAIAENPATAAALASELDPRDVKGTWMRFRHCTAVDGNLFGAVGDQAVCRFRDADGLLHVHMGLDGVIHVMEEPDDEPPAAAAATGKEEATA